MKSSSIDSISTNNIKTPYKSFNWTTAVKVSLFVIGCIFAVGGGYALYTHHAIGYTLEVCAFLFLVSSLITHLVQRQANSKRAELEKAIAGKEYDRIRQFAINFNQLCENGETYLTRAVQMGDLELVKAFIASGADPNQRNHWNKRPIDLAVENFDVKIAGYLWKKKSGLELKQDLMDKATTIDLERATRERNKVVIWGHFLRGVSNNTIGKKIIKLGMYELYPFGRILDPHFNDKVELQARRLLAHVFEIDGDTTLNGNTESLEGMWSSESQSLIAQMATTFKFSNIHFFIDDDYSSQQIHDQMSVNSSHPIIFSRKIPIKNESHRVGYMILGNKLWVGERGMLGLNGAVCFQKDKISQEDIEKLRSTVISAGDPKKEFLNLLNERGFKQIFLIPLKEQAVGNCGWAFIEALFAGLFHEFYPGQEQSLTKTFIFECRKAALNKYLNESKNPDHALLQRISAKINELADEPRYRELIPN